MVNYSTSDQKMIPFEKISQKERIKFFHFTLRFRINQVY